MRQRLTCSRRCGLVGRREKTFLAGEFSVADIAMATVLKELQDTSLVSSRLRLSAYLDRCLARPAYQRALDAQIEVFRRTSAEGA